MFSPTLVQILAISCVICTVSYADEDLYQVLGVKKSSTSSEIKKAYKGLAKEWHPDRNKDPGANEKFIKINEAYETLMDPEKRSNYDNFGQTSASQGQERRRGGFPGGFSPFQSFFSDSPFGSFNFGGFNFGSDFDSGVEKYMLTSRKYESKVLPESKEKPYLIYAYKDFCFGCMEVERIWDRIVQDLDTIGMGIGSVNVQIDRRLTSKLRITTIPTIAAVINGKLKYFSGSYTIPNMRSFIRGLFDTSLVTRVDKSNIEQFLGGWEDNRVRAVFFDNRPEPSLRFLMSAFQYRQRVAAGYVCTSDMATFDIQSKYKVSRGVESLMVFKEDLDKPVATSSMESLSRGMMDETLEANQFLLLPRLSNQRVFNDLCPPYSSKQKKKLCVVLLSQRSPDHEPYRATFRQHAAQHVKYYERVKYAYVYEDTQSHFVKDLTDGKGVSNDTTGSLQVAVLWRKDKESLHYNLLEGGWPEASSAEFEDAPGRLASLVELIMDGSKRSALPYVMDMPAELTDEHADMILIRIMRRLIDWADRAYEKIMMYYYTMDEVTMVTIIAAIFVSITFFIMMKSMMNMEEENIQREAGGHRSRPRERRRPVQQQQRAAAQPTVYIHPMCSENFERLVVNLDPGVRTVVVLVDEGTKKKLLQNFAMAVHQYSNTEAFNFAFLQLEQFVGWYRLLLEQTLDFKRDLQAINVKNCVGTVLAINGFRKYYAMYHARQEPQRARQRGADFIGLEDSESESEAEKLFQGDLLAGLGTWMERLCEGTVCRYRVEYWPSMECMM